MSDQMTIFDFIDAPFEVGETVFFTTCNESISSEYITHWMPLPELPEEVEE